MMDIKEIIKWFIPCFHILLVKNKELRAYLTLFCLLLFLNSGTGSKAKETAGSGLEISENDGGSTKNLGLSDKTYVNSLSFNQSEYITQDVESSRSIQDVSVGRTFGRPFKKMMAGLLPIVFQVGAASTWAVVAAVVGFKTLLVTLLILKLLLLAGAAKFGALFASKAHGHSHGWEPPSHDYSHGWEPAQSKEIHVHIHNGKHYEDTSHESLPYAGWSREGVDANLQDKDTKNIKVVIEPYSSGGPQTISTPYGNYVKIDPNPSIPSYNNDNVLHGTSRSLKT